ncbi:MAG: hypothetical protein II431_04020, partial [Prevotella sp.]|nr:hypothetical protein [Prevotella sp.]
GVLVYNPQTDNRSLRDVLYEAGLKPDVEALSAQNLYFCHRRTAQEDIYFLNNHNDQKITDCFR